MKTKTIAEFLEGNLIGDGEIEISGVANLENANAGEISFVEKQENLAETKADCLLVPEHFTLKLPSAFIQVKNPKLAFAKIAEILHPQKKREKNYSSNSSYCRKRKTRKRSVHRRVCLCRRKFGNWR